MRNMKVSPSLCAGLACAMFTFVAPATASPDDGRSSPALTHAGSAAGDAAPVRGDPRIKAQRAIHQSASPNAERLHSLLNTQARGHLARQPGRPTGSVRAATGGLGVRGPNGVGAAGSPKLAASKRGASPVPKLTATPRNSAIGGPRVQSVGRLGGAVIGRTNHSAAIDGTELRHKF
jgi:hypothetical protein